MTDSNDSSTDSASENEILFSDLALSEPVFKALDKVGYVKPSPIQAEIIPYILDGRDVLGQAQTGTGKTAAFALPLLSKIDANLKRTQVLVVVPTRELAGQVADACAKYATFMPKVNVLSVYGGQDYRQQTRGLSQGAQVVIGTPGRVMDHMRKGTLKLNDLKCLVLDEADEMLRMGFIDDVEWIMSHIDDDAQIALFSATMPKQIDKIARKYLTDPKVVQVSSSVKTADTIKQCYWYISGLRKNEALVRFLEAEETDGCIVFTRTKAATEEVAQHLRDNGFKASSINGDMVQKQRERSIEHLKNGKLDIVVATDVAARGLDVKRMSHVFNYDAPFDSEAYVHRIGRTGRAGRSGTAIMFISSRDRHILRRIERDTKQSIQEIDLPSVQAINEKRMKALGELLIKVLQNTTSIKNFPKYRAFIAQLRENDELAELVTNEDDVLSAFMHLLHEAKPLILSETARAPRQNRERGGDRRDRGGRDRGGNERGRSRGRERGDRNERSRSSRPVSERDHPVEKGKTTYRIEVGRSHDVSPGNIVGAIANETGMSSANIGQISIRNDFTLVDLPEGTGAKVIDKLKGVIVQGRKLKISVNKGDGKAGSGASSRSSGRNSDRSDREDRAPRRKDTSESTPEKRKKPKSTFATYADKKGGKKKVRAKDKANKGKPKRKTRSIDAEAKAKDLSSRTPPSERAPKATLTRKPRK